MTRKTIVPRPYLTARDVSSFETSFGAGRLGRQFRTVTGNLDPRCCVWSSLQAHDSLVAGGVADASTQEEEETQFSRITDD